jgi:hypothetical protein
MRTSCHCREMTQPQDLGRPSEKLLCKEKRIGMAAAEEQDHAKYASRLAGVIKGERLSWRNYQALLRGQIIK